jgi:hypothetical protein
LTWEGEVGLEGVVERGHHRNVVREAKANLASEIADNQKLIEAGIKGMDTTQEQLQGTLRLVRALQADRKAKRTDVSLNVSIFTLRSTAWSTAGATGALGYMEQQEVERYTEIYDLQEQFLSVQRRALDAMLEMESYGTLLQGDLARISDAQAVEGERAVGRALAATRMAEDVGKALDAEYGRFAGAR